MTTCPHCGADQRLGVWLTPKRLRVFDAIQKAGEQGVSGPVLCERLGIGRVLLRVHIQDINGFLVETDYRIVSRPYRLVKS